VIGTKGVPNPVLAVGGAFGTVVTVTLTTVSSGIEGLVFGPNGSGCAQSPGCGVCHPESWMLVGITVTLGAEVVKVPTITPLDTS